MCIRDRKRFDKDIKEAIDFGGFNFARENLAILDNLQRAHISIKNDPALKDNKDLDKFLKNIEIIEKDLISIFKKNKIEKIDTYKKKIYIYGIALTKDERKEVISEAKQILDVEDVIASILLVDDLRVQKN